MNAIYCLSVVGMLYYKLIFLSINGTPHTWAENIYFGHKILMKPTHDYCSY